LLVLALAAVCHRGCNKDEEQEVSQLTGQELTWIMLGCMDWILMIGYAVMMTADGTDGVWIVLHVNFAVQVALTLCFCIAFYARLYRKVRGAGREILNV
jgi:predicted Co/Zn/Cd cation transporter (cation efflux family)